VFYRTSRGAESEFPENPTGGHWVGMTALPGSPKIVLTPNEANSCRLMAQSTEVSGHPAVRRYALAFSGAVSDNRLVATCAAATAIRPVGAVHPNAAHREILRHTDPGSRVQAPDEWNLGGEFVGHASRCARERDSKDDQEARRHWRGGPPRREWTLDFLPCGHVRNVAVGSARYPVVCDSAAHHHAALG
jgi:hypothetical protein